MEYLKVFYKDLETVIRKIKESGAQQANYNNKKLSKFLRGQQITAVGLEKSTKS